MSFAKFDMIVILGPTASGKTSVAAHLASLIQGEIISADSRQVYRQLTIGTGKDYEDYLINGARVPCHLIDIADAGTQYNVYEYQNDFKRVYENILERGKIPVLCGGSGMYIEAVTKGYKLIQVPVNPSLRLELEGKSLVELAGILKQMKTIHANSDIDTTKRAIRAIEIETYYSSHPLNETDFPVIHPLWIGIKYERPAQRDIITRRLQQRLRQGMVDEVKKLLDSGITPDQLIYYGLEYKFLTRYLIGEMDYDTMFNLLNTAIHQFAKRQMTWFRRMESLGIPIHWLDGAWTLERKVEKILGLWQMR